MGMFDSIMVDCPKCKNKIEFQTKALGGSLSCYTIKNAPKVCIADLGGEVFHCGKCDCWFSFTVKTPPKVVLISKKKIAEIKKDGFYMIWGTDPDEEEYNG